MREAAIALFGREGFGVPLRTIASDAGITAGRIVQLFDSKDGLQRACDEHVFGMIREGKRESMRPGSGTSVFLGMLADLDDRVPYMAYAARSVQAGGQHAREFIDHVVDDAVAYVTEYVAGGAVLPSRDERARVRYLVESSLGHLALRLSLDAPRSSEELADSFRRYVGDVTLPALELYTQGFLTDRRMLDAYLLYVGDPPGQDQAESA
ncbi:TetR family transcriptional regulator [Pseudactinotalea sp.]|uniref:TetR/AcrR family transcriptional regulator n=1 Tax=Pseudactinotalea sp. TaxID=1926260 RepID=UPI003B3B18DC